MKKLIYLLSGLLFAACQGPQQPSVLPPSAKPDTKGQPSSTEEVHTNLQVPSSLSEIKSAYAATMAKLKNRIFDSITVRYNCKQERSGSITYYTEHKKMRLIKHTYAEYDHHEATDQYFAQDDTLYFVHLHRLSWSFESGAAAEAATKDDITESRFYLIRTKPVLCLEKKYTVHSSTPDKPMSNLIPNRTIDCKSIQPLLSTFEKLAAFQSRSNGECFDK